MSDFRLVQTQTGWGKVLGEFATWIDPQPGWNTLDVGCGPGLFPALLQARGCRAYGVDLDLGMFQPHPLHPRVVLADAVRLPYPKGNFDLVTASNLLFLLPRPDDVLQEMVRVLHPQGSLALLNPSENLSAALVNSYADQRGLEGLARSSLLNWAERAEAGKRWSEAELEHLFQREGLRLTATAIKMGPGLASFARGIHVSSL